VSPVAGVDGCRGGWMVARLRGRDLTLEVLASFTEVMRWTEDCAVVAVDMPIGLPERSGIGGRACDSAARAVLGARQSSLFAVPARDAVMAGDYAAASALALTRSDPPRKVSKQCFNLFPKIREVDAALTPELQLRVVECHPECAFWVLNGRVPLPEPKRVRSQPHLPGLVLRRRLLVDAGIVVPVDGHPWPRAVAGEDDVLDACACAATAARIRDGVAHRFPGEPPVDRRGLRMEIWA
jgi:predicted RNase H-like nuclease